LLLHGGCRQSVPPAEMVEGELSPLVYQDRPPFVTVIHPQAKNSAASYESPVRNSALRVMKEGSATVKPAGAVGQLRLAQEKTVPTIVFHGDRDTTVHPRNGDQIIKQLTSSIAHNGGDARSENLPHVMTGRADVPRGRTYTRSLYRNGDGKTIAEQWVVHGAGHAWSGGSRGRRFTDAKGPDAGKEMLRFFFDRSSKDA
jgi:poly(3-hydroxybutyrate) depolymerase